jgi:hypothetical protein
MSELESLTLRAIELASKVDFWNNAVLVALFVTALAAAGIVAAQRKAFVRTKELSDVQARISSIKEAGATAEQERIGTELAAAVARAREADARIAEAQRGSAEANERATKAQESLALAEQHSAEANAKAEGFRLDIAKANESAAQARAQVAGATAEAARANLELAKLKTPRTLTKEQRYRITSRIKPFPETPYDLWVNTDSDSTALMFVIDEAIRAANWQFKLAGVIAFADRAGIIADSGVSIHVAEEHRSTLEGPALALGNALIAEGIPVALFADTKDSNNDKDRDRLHLMIGSKPLN